MDHLHGVAICLLAVFVWRQFTLSVLEHASWWQRLSRDFRTAMQYYVLLYIVLGIFLLSDLIEMGHILAKHPLLHPSTFSVWPGMPDEDRHCPLWLAILSLGTPAAAVGSYFLGAYHTGRHALAIRKFGYGHLSSSVQRDRTVQVIAFPAIFSVMAFGAVVELWSLLTGYGPSPSKLKGMPGSEWDERKGYVVQRYTAYFAVADFYEAYALLVFVWLSLDELETNMRYTSDSARSPAQSSRSALSSSFSDNEAELTEQQSVMVKVLRSLTMQGVLWFVFTCFLDATFDLYVVQYTQAHYYNQPPWSESGEMCIYGMGFLSSSAAITNVVSVERSLHEYFGDFRCAPKFLSCKIMVSIAFFQTIALTIFGGVLTGLESKVLYASLICYEVLVLTIFHCYAWPEDEPWLQNTERGRKEARARWRYAVTNVATAQKMIAWLHRARARIQERRRREWSKLPSQEDPLSPSTRSASPVRTPTSSQELPCLAAFSTPRLWAPVNALKQTAPLSTRTPVWYRPRPVYSRPHSPEDSRLSTGSSVQLQAVPTSAPPTVRLSHPLQVQAPSNTPVPPLHPLPAHSAVPSLARVQALGRARVPQQPPISSPPPFLGVPSKPPEKR